MNLALILESKGRMLTICLANDIYINLLRLFNFVETHFPTLNNVGVRLIQGSIKYSHGLNPACKLFWYIKFCWHTVTPMVPLSIVLGCSCAVQKEQINGEYHNWT